MVTNTAVTNHPQIPVAKHNESLFAYFLVQCGLMGVELRDSTLCSHASCFGTWPFPTLHCFESVYGRILLISLTRCLATIGIIYLFICTVPIICLLIIFYMCVDD